MKTKTEIVVETIQHYLRDPANRRSVSSEGTCLYQHPEHPDRQCAVGRCFQPDTLKDLLFDPASNCKAIHELAINDSIDHLLKPEYRGHDLKFWRNLQSIHDNPGFWADLQSDRTKSFRKSLILLFGTETYDACVKLNLV